MSINQIQQSNRFLGDRKWLNVRVDDLTIHNRLDVEVELADPGDILKLDVNNQITWVPSSLPVPGLLEKMFTRFNTYVFTAGARNPISISSSYIVSDPTIVVNPDGELIINGDGIYMIAVNLHANINSTTQNPGLILQRFNEQTQEFVDDLDGLAKTSIIASSENTPITQTLSSVYYIYSGNISSRFRIMGFNRGTTNCSLLQTDSTITVVKIS